MKLAETGTGGFRKWIDREKKRSRKSLVNEGKKNKDDLNHFFKNKYTV